MFIGLSSIKILHGNKINIYSLQFPEYQKSGKRRMGKEVRKRRRAWGRTREILQKVRGRCKPLLHCSPLQAFPRPSPIWLHWVLVAASGFFSCSVWDPVPWPGMEPALSPPTPPPDLHWELRVLVTGLPRNSPFLHFYISTRRDSKPSFGLSLISLNPCLFLKYLAREESYELVQSAPSPPLEFSPWK